MTLSQIQYFLEVARCKNISEAAKCLFITQPTLSRQITTIETELNMQLIIRNNKGIKLTPAGMVLQEEWEKTLACHNNGVARAKLANQGFSATLNIGVLEDLKVIDFIPPMIDYFEKNYPNININIKRMSFGNLLDNLHHGKLDAVISLDVNFFEQTDLDIQNLKPYRPAFAVPRHHVLAQKDSLNFGDFDGVPMAIVEKSDCGAGVRKIENIFRTYGNFYPNFYFTTSMQDAILWVKSGKKCAVLNMEMEIADSPQVKMFPFDLKDNPFIQFASKKDNTSFELRLLKEFYAMP